MQETVCAGVSPFEIIHTAKIKYGREIIRKAGNRESMHGRQTGNGKDYSVEKKCSWTFQLLDIFSLPIIYAYLRRVFLRIDNFDVYI